MDQSGNSRSKFLNFTHTINRSIKIWPWVKEMVFALSLVQGSLLLLEQKSIIMQYHYYDIANLANLCVFSKGSH